MSESSQTVEKIKISSRNDRNEIHDQENQKPKKSEACY